MKEKILFLWIILFMSTAHFSLVQAAAGDDSDLHMKEAVVFFTSKDGSGNYNTKPLTTMVRPNHDFQEGCIKVEELFRCFKKTFDDQKSEVRGIDFDQFNKNGGKVRQGERSLNLGDTIAIELVVDPNPNILSEDPLWVPQIYIDASSF